MHLAQLRASLYVNWLLLCGSPNGNCNSRPILVQRCTDEASSHVVRACSAAGWGVGGGQEGIQRASVQQVSDKAQEHCKTGSPSHVSSDPRGLVLKCVGGVEWELHTQKMIQGHALEREGRGHYL